MDSSGCTLHKISSVLLSLLLLAQFQHILASGLYTYLNVCGDNHIKYWDDSHQPVFYINGQLLDRYLFCEALIFYGENHCFIHRNVRQRYCGLDSALNKLPVRTITKLSRKVAVEGSMEKQFKTEESYEKDNQGSMLSPMNLAVAAPAAFLLCCSIICPCFWARRRTAHTVLREPESLDSISSMEMSSVQEKIPGSPQRILGSPQRILGSPQRVPGSPLRVPGSPLRVLPSPFRVPGSPMRVPPSPPRFSMSPKLDRLGSVHVTMSQVVRATHNFSDSLKIGEGGFGTVYKARLPDGQLVAIKRAKKELSGNLRTEFRSEVELLTKIDHRNLVKTLGYVDKGDDRVIIAEYVPNGTLREHLDGMRGNILDFKQRLEISIDVAHALTYLHVYAEKQIIHRDVKSSNILLTESMRAKVADFGFAKLGDLDTDKTHVSTKVKGTVGYLDPEYMKTNQLTTKSDVYSFGILLLEILTGRRPVELKKTAEERVTLRWAFKKYNELRVADLIDPLMNEVVDRDILMKMVGLAIQCAAPTRSDRPDMRVVGEQLWVIRMDYLKTGRS